MRGGHNAKPTRQLIRGGTYNKTRHGDRVDDQYQGAPEQIRGLGKDGLELWRLVESSTPPGVLAQIDGPAMFAMCRWWALFRKFERKAGKPEGTANDLHMAVCTWKQCSQLLVQFGMTPVSRTHVRKGNADSIDQNDPLSAMILARVGPPAV